MKLPKHFLSNEYLEIAEFVFKVYETDLANGDTNWRMPICPQLGYATIKPFRTAFKPESLGIEDRWYDDFRNEHVTKEEYNRIRDHRVFSLLIMHELAKDYEELLEKSK